MKAKKLEWIEKENFFEAKSACNDYWFHKQKFRLFYNLGILGIFDTIESAKQAAQDHADRLIKDMIDPDYLLELARFAMNEGYKNATCPTLVYTAEEVLEKFKQKP